MALVERIAVTGVGAVSALGADAASSFSRLCSGAVGIREVTLFDTRGLASQKAAEVSDLVVEVPATSRTDALALTAAREAIAAARFEAANRRLGVALGGTAGGMLETEGELLAALGKSTDAGRARRLVTHPLSKSTELLGRALGPVARSATVCSACASGASAIALGAHWLRAGHVDAVLVGGADGLCRMTFAGFASLGVMDARVCRPFAVDRAGLSLGEGAGFLLLELESAAARRDARVLAWLSGWAVGAEAHHMTHPEPTGARAARLIDEALSRAGLEPRDIHYVNAHGTGTRANDAMEALALARVFAGCLDRVHVSSSKAQLGHTLGAAGALEAVISVQCLGHGAIPPTAGLDVAESPELLHVRSTLRAPLGAVLSNSFGFGGLDAVLIFEHVDAPRRELRQQRSRGLVVSGAAVLTRDERAGLAAAALLATPLVDTSVDALAALDPERSRRFDGLSALTTRAAELCLANARRDAGGVGLVAGSAYGSVERSLKFLDRCFERGFRQAAPAEFPHLVQSAAVGNAAIYLGLSGPAFAVCEGATSGESAFFAGVSLLELGSAQAVLVAAAEASDAVVAELASALDPASRATRRQGAGCLLLEREEAARERSHAPLARLVAHEQIRDGGRFSNAALAAPAEPASARVLLASPAEDWARELELTPWANVARANVRAHVGFFEAVGAVALAIAAAAIGDGASEVLVLGLDEGVRYLTRLARPEPG